MFKNVVFFFHFILFTSKQTATHLTINNMLYRSGGDVDLSSSQLYEDECANYNQNSSVTFVLTDDDRSAEARAQAASERDNYGANAVNADPSMVEVDVPMIARNTTVKFQDRSDDESSVNGTETEVHHRA